MNAYGSDIRIAGGAVRRKHQAARERLEKTNLKNQIASIIQREHQMIKVTWRIAGRIPIHSKIRRHDPGADKEECEDYWVDFETATMAWELTSAMRCKSSASVMIHSLLQLGTIGDGLIGDR